MGEYIMEHYQIPDQRNNAAYGDWFADYEAYKALKEKTLQALGSWDTYLMLLADKHLDSVIEISSPDLWSNERFVDLVENLGIERASVSDATNFLIIREGGTQAEAVTLSTDADAQRDTVMGLLRVSFDGPGAYSVYLDDTLCFLPDESNTGSLRIYVRDSEDRDAVGQAAF